LSGIEHGTVLSGSGDRHDATFYANQQGMTSRFP
jgi:hypothetical protein